MEIHHCWWSREIGVGQKVRNQMIIFELRHYGKNLWRLMVNYFGIERARQYHPLIIIGGIDQKECRRVAIEMNREDRQEELREMDRPTRIESPAVRWTEISTEKATKNQRNGNDHDHELVGAVSFMINSQKKTYFSVQSYFVLINQTFFF